MQTDVVTGNADQGDVNAALNLWVAEFLLRHGAVQRFGM